MLWILGGAWVLAGLLAGGHAWLARSGRARRAAPPDGPELGAAGAAREAAEGADPFMGRAFGEELDIVLRTAAHHAAARDAPVDAAGFVAAALCNRALAERLARAGHALADARAALAALPRRTPAQGSLDGSSGNAVIDLEVEAAVTTAARRTVGLLRPLALGAVLDALAAGDGPVASWLAGLGVRFAALPDEPAFAADSGPFLWNDRVTTMAAVVTLLTTVFELEPLEAVYTMYTVHLRGFAALGPFPPARRRELRAAAQAHGAAHGLRLRVTDTPPDLCDWRDDPASGRVPPD
ncbi:MAG: ATP-dependent Clp protease adaptor ClpS [Myxococcales bacterium]|nr:ATP-dependent Clp protease adaptor ClpS [Myxococcales bacterium]